MDLTFSEDEIQRYSRHILLKELGGTGQSRLRAASVLIIGAGGLGSPLALYLAAAGVGRMGLVDDDQVELARSRMARPISAARRPRAPRTRSPGSTRSSRSISTKPAWPPPTPPA
jgi:molybdopterin/thiamine biosynthesis adenylyltransferase